MKNFLFLIFLCINSFLLHADTLSLTEALAGKMLDFNFEGNGNSTHYLNPLNVSIQNKLNKTITVSIDNGQQFLSSDSSLQNLVIVKREVIIIPPYQKKSAPLYAMCIQMHDGAPATGINYSKGDFSKGALLELTKLIEKNKYFDIAAQHAVWCLTDSASIIDISGFDSTEIRNLQQLISKATGQPMPPKPAIDDYAHNYHAPVSTTVYEGSFNYTVRKPAVVLIAMFDKDNRVVRELFRDNNAQPGSRSFKFEFDASTYKDDFYYIRLLIDGEKRIEGTVDNR